MLSRRVVRKPLKRVVFCEDNFQNDRECIAMASGVWGAACVEQQQLGLTEVLMSVEGKRRRLCGARPLTPLYKMEKNQILHNFMSLSCCATPDDFVFRPVECTCISFPGSVP